MDLQKDIFVRTTLFYLFLFVGISSLLSQAKEGSYVELSSTLLRNVKEGHEYKGIVGSIAKINSDSLEGELKNPVLKNVFWINIYNAFIQITLKNEAEQYEDRSAFFSKDRIVVAGMQLSFDDIEHGILRASTWKFSLGYMKNPFAPEFETKFRLSKTDKRIHFALNCGARSCPPIAIYTAENFNQKIDEVSRYYLNEISEVDQEQNTVYTTPLFSWFRGDFGGSSGIRKTLIEYGVLKKGSDLSIEYKDYDWTLVLDKYYD